MPRVDVNTLLIVDGVLLAAGGVCVLVGLAWLARSGAWRDPLARREPPGSPPLLAAPALWLLAQLLPGALFQPARFQSPGSSEWHTATTVVHAATFVLGLGGLWLVRASQFSVRQVTRPKDTARLALASAAVALAAIALCTTQLRAVKYLWRWWSPDIAQPTHPVLQALEQSAWGPWGALHLALAAVIVAPVFEEVLFRGLLLRSVWSLARSPWPAVIISGVAFGLVHAAQPQDVLPLLTFGLLLGALAVRTGRLWPCIFVHSLFNLRTISLAVLNPEILRADW